MQHVEEAVEQHEFDALTSVSLHIFEVDYAEDNIKRVVSRFNFYPELHVGSLALRSIIVPVHETQEDEHDAEAGIIGLLLFDSVELLLPLDVTKACATINLEVAQVQLLVKLAVVRLHP